MRHPSFALLLASLCLLPACRLQEGVPGGDLTVPGAALPSGSPLPSASPGASAAPGSSPSPGSSGSPLPNPSATAFLPGFGSGGSSSGKPGAVTLTLKVTDRNPSQAGKSRCAATVTPFTYFLRRKGVTTQQEVKVSDLSADSYTIPLADLTTGEQIGLTIPSQQNADGISLFPTLTRQITVSTSPQNVQLEIPAKVWPEDSAYLSEAGDSYELVRDLDPQDDSLIGAGESFTKGWELQNTSASVTWSGRQFATIDPQTRYFPGLKPASLSLPIPSTGPGQTQTMQVAMTAPQRPGLYRSSWMFRKGNQYVLPEAQVFTQLRVSGVRSLDAFTPGDAYEEGDSQVLLANGNRQILPYNFAVYAGASVQVIYTLKNTGNQLWSGRKLTWLSDGIASEHQLTPDRKSLDVPLTAPGETARIGPVTLSVGSLQSHYAGWRLSEPDGSPAFGGAPDLVTQFAVTPIPAYCR
ncbi:MAG: NBR1-Ig-like domain-containing protein [Candidatus Sericytochromatia bacterium]